jgi:hypothetical protein
VVRKVQDQGPPKALWAYAYEITPPESEERLRAIEGILEQVRTAARATARSWTARVVLEERLTHILVVSDSREQDLDLNRQLEVELAALQVGYQITVPMAATDGDATA